MFTAIAKAYDFLFSDEDINFIVSTASTLVGGAAAAAAFVEPSALLGSGFALGRGLLIFIYSSYIAVAEDTAYQLDGFRFIFSGCAFGSGSGRSLRQATTLALALARARARFFRGRSSNSYLYALFNESITGVFVDVVAEAFEVITIECESDECFRITLGAAGGGGFGFGEPSFITFDLRDVRNECIQ